MFVCIKSPIEMPANRILWHITATVDMTLELLLQCIPEIVKLCRQLYCAHAQ